MGGAIKEVCMLRWGLLPPPEGMDLLGADDEALWSEYLACRSAAEEGALKGPGYADARRSCAGAGAGRSCADAYWGAGATHHTFDVQSM